MMLYRIMLCLFIFGLASGAINEAGVYNVSLPGSDVNIVAADVEDFASSSDGGLNVFSALLHKPFIPPAPDADAGAHLFRSGELFAHYAAWRIEHCAEEVFDCMSSGVPHQHAVNRMVARKEPAG